MPSEQGRKWECARNTFDAEQVGQDVTDACMYAWLYNNIHAWLYMHAIIVATNLLATLDVLYHVLQFYASRSESFCLAV